ncbi:MAG: hypothetical protein HZB79_05470 [Deltaproteobacteria bacterium]|nr:hypothetical protein [Deltaproteobacteria bacterium]
MKHKRLIIPIFVPQSGCPHQCVFCNQEKITSKTAIPTPEDIKQTIYAYLDTWKGKGEKEIAFYGILIHGKGRVKRKLHFTAAHLHP